MVSRPHRRFVQATLGIAIGAVASALLISPGGAASPSSAEGDPVRGKTVFARCAGCHKIDRGAAGGFGPNLAGIYGQPAGRQPGYPYSAAMKASRLRFDAATLSRFLAGPTKVVPGTKMAIPPVANPKDRADLIAFLKTNGGAKK